MSQVVDDDEYLKQFDDLDLEEEAVIPAAPVDPPPDSLPESIRVNADIRITTIQRAVEFSPQARPLPTAPNKLPSMTEQALISSILSSTDHQPQDEDAEMLEHILNEERDEEEEHNYSEDNELDEIEGVLGASIHALRDTQRLNQLKIEALLSPSAKQAEGESVEAEKSKEKPHPLIRGKSFLEDILQEEDDDASVPMIKLAPLMEQRLLKEILAHDDYDITSPAWIEETKSLNRRAVVSKKNKPVKAKSFAEVGRKNASIDLTAPRDVSDAEKHALYQRSVAMVDVKSKKAKKIDEKKSDSVSEESRSASAKGDKSPKKSKKEKDASGFSKIAQMARSRIKKLAVDALKQLASEDEKEVQFVPDNNNFETPNQVEMRKTMLKAKLLTATQSVRKVDARFAPIQDRPEYVGKIPLARIYNWEEMLTGIFKQDFTEKGKDRIGRPIRKIDEQRKEVINQVMAKRFEAIGEAVSKSRANSLSTPRFVSAIPMLSPKLESDTLDALQAKVNDVRENYDRSHTKNEDVSGDASKSKTLWRSDSKENVESKSILGDRPKEESGLPSNIQDLIEYILQDSELLTSLEMYNYQFFHALASEDPQRKTLETLLGESLGLNTHITSITCSKCALSDAFVSSLASWARKGEFRSLKKLDLSGNLISDSGITTIAQCLTENVFSELQVLKLKTQLNPPSLTSIQLLSWALRGNFTLLELEIDSLQYEDDRYEEAFKLIRRCLKRNVAVKSGKNHLKVVFLTTLEERIKKIILNEDDDSEDFSLDSDFMFKLLPDIVKCGLAKGLKSNNQIHSLALKNLNLHDEFAFALAESLVENNTLDSIDLSGNSFSSVGIQVLVEALAANRSVRTFSVSSVNLSEKPISPEDESFMLNRLQENTTLVKVSLPISSPEAVQLLDKMIQRNCMEKFQMWKSK